MWPNSFSETGKHEDNCILCRYNHLYILDCEDRLRVSSSSNSSSNTIMAPKAPVPDFPLRLLTLLLFIPAFPFLLAHGIVAEYVLPALGLIPMSLSAVSGIAHLTGRVSKNSGWGCVADFWIAGFLIAILIPSWITMAEGYHYTRRDGLVAAYGTVPMMVALYVVLPLMRLSASSLLTRILAASTPTSLSALSGRSRGSRGRRDVRTVMEICGPRRRRRARGMGRFRCGTRRKDGLVGGLRMMLTMVMMELRKGRVRMMRRRS